MHIITIMNYEKKNEIIMCKAWIYFAKRFNPGTKITIFHQNPIVEILRYSSLFTNVHSIQLSKKDAHVRITGEYTDHPIQELRLAVWKETEKRSMHKFIYVDADAFILDSLEPWWKHIGDKPYIAINQQITPQQTFFNAGVHSYNDTSGFVTYEKLLKQYRDDGNKITLFGGEQGLINAYFRRIHYSYDHPLIDFSYNCFAKNCRVQTVSDKNIIIFSGTYPWYKKFVHRLNGTQPQWWENWVGWNQRKKAKILHAFGKKGFKFWELPECKPLWEYCQKITTV